MRYRISRTPRSFDSIEREYENRQERLREESEAEEAAAEERETLRKAEEDIAEEAYKDSLQ